MAEGMHDVEDEDEDEDGEEGAVGRGDDGEEGEEDEEDDGPEEPVERSNPADPRSSCTYMLPSLFAGKPATVWIDYPKFMGEERTEGSETIYELEDRRLKPLLFKSARNINCIANCFKRVGFRRLVKGTSFNVYWGHHLNEKEFSKLAPQQLVNHFPGSFGIGRKDYLWKNLSRMQRMHGAAYDFVAKSYMLPRDREYFERDYNEGEVYIVKPPASAEGRGIRLMTKMEQAPKGTVPVLVQKYLGEPYLINNKKFDLRIYIGVTSFDPLRCYIFDEGLARFATSDYTPVTSQNRKNRYMHLTNYSVNKKSPDFEWNTDADADGEGSKWSLTATWKHLAEKGAPPLLPSPHPSPPSPPSSPHLLANHALPILRPLRLRTRTRIRLHGTPSFAAPHLAPSPCPAATAQASTSRRCRSGSRTSASRRSSPSNTRSSHGATRRAITRQPASRSSASTCCSTRTSSRGSSKSTSPARSHRRTPGP